MGWGVSGGGRGGWGGALVVVVGVGGVGRK